MNRRDALKAGAGLAMAGLGLGAGESGATAAESPAGPRAGSLAEFVRESWPIVGGGHALTWNWSHQALCDHLEAVTRGDIRRLVVSQPPGHLTSTIASVCWPAWAWTTDPSSRWLTLAYCRDLAARDVARSRDLIRSDGYVSRHGEVFDPDKGRGSGRSMHFSDGGGFRRGADFSGSHAGWRVDCVVADTPIHPGDRHSAREKDRADFTWNQVLPSRINDPRTARFVVLGARLAKDDLAGRVLARGDYEHLCLPAEFDPSRRCRTSTGWADPRTRIGELIHPGFFTTEFILQARLLHGPEEYAAMFQQNPLD